MPEFHLLPVTAITALLVTAAANGGTSDILPDYIYGYAPVAMEATRSLLTAVPNASTVPGLAPINQFSYGNILATPDERIIIRPNADTLYTTAWLDLAQEPMILHVPDTGGRYYLMPMLDAYSNDFASIGSRTTGTGEGNYAIVGPFWRGTLPQGLSGVVDAPTNTVWLIGRTLVHGEADLASAAELTKQYKLVPLSAYPDFAATGVYTPPGNVPVTPPNPDFTGAPITNSPVFSKPQFFDVLSKIALRNPPPPPQLLQASRLVLDGFIHQNQLTPDTVTQADNAFAAKLRATVTQQNGWSINGGSYGTDYLERAAITRIGFGTNIPADAVYPSTTMDASGNPLVGTNSYVIHFVPGQTPPVRGFWSLTVYDENGFLVANSINRYAAGSETGLVPNADGSIDILLQNTAPATMQSNWLPTPTTAFSLTLRLYWPDEPVLNGTWTIPAVQPGAAGLP